MLLPFQKQGFSKKASFENQEGIVYLFSSDQLPVAEDFHGTLDSKWKTVKEGMSWDNGGNVSFSSGEFFSFEYVDINFSGDIPLFRFCPQNLGLALAMRSKSRLPPRLAVKDMAESLVWKVSSVIQSDKLFHPLIRGECH